MDKTNSAQMAKLAIKALEDKKAEDVRVIDISEISVLADYFIIANGLNVSQVAILTQIKPRNDGKRNVKKNVPEAGSGCRDRFSGRTQHGSG